MAHDDVADLRGVLGRLGWSSDPAMGRTAERVLEGWQARAAIGLRPTLTVVDLTVDQYVAFRAIGVTGMCPHHLVPYAARIDVGFVSTGKGLGLGSVRRLAEWHALPPRLQEELTVKLAEALSTELRTTVAVRVVGRHACDVRDGEFGVLETSFGPADQLARLRA